jgi:DNA-binding response OmpR family regulator
MATILVVDDDYFIRNLLRVVLTVNKHNVLEAQMGWKLSRPLIQMHYQT